MSYKMYSVCTKKVIGKGTENEKTIWPRTGTLHRRTEKKMDDQGNEYEEERFNLDLDMWPDQRYYCFEVDLDRKKNTPDF